MFDRSDWTRSEVFFLSILVSLFPFWEKKTAGSFGQEVKKPQVV